MSYLKTVAGDENRILNMKANKLTEELIDQIIDFQGENNLPEGKLVKQLCLTLGAYLAANVEADDYDLVLNAVHDFLRLAVTDMATAASEAVHYTH